VTSATSLKRSSEKKIEYRLLYMKKTGFSYEFNFLKWLS